MQNRSPRYLSVLAILVWVVVGTPNRGGTSATDNQNGVSQFSNWGPPVNLGAVVNTSANEQGPAVSPDGLALYFDSDRPGGAGGRDLWVSRRISVDAPWGAARNLGPVINSGGTDQTPGMSPDGLLLLFASSRAGALGETDLWMSHRADIQDDLGWHAPVNLGPGVNTKMAEAAPFFLGERTTLFFSRGLTTANQDLLVSQARGTTFGDAVPVTELNTSDTEAHPTVRRDSLEVLFYSGRSGGLGLTDIWSSTRTTPDGRWSPPVNVKGLNTPFLDVHPTLTLDGMTLFFVSNRPGGSGANDLYVSQRTRTR